MSRIRLAGLFNPENRLDAANTGDSRVGRHFAVAPAAFKQDRLDGHAGISHINDSGPDTLRRHTNLLHRFSPIKERYDGSRLRDAG